MAGRSGLEEARRLTALDATGVLDEEVQSRFARTLAMMSRYFDMQMASIVVVAENQRRVVKAHHGFVDVDPQLPADGVTTIIALESDDGLIVERGSDDPRFAHLPAFASGRLQSYLGRPLRTPDGQPVGVLSLGDARPRAFTPEALQDFRRMAQWVEEELLRESDTRRALAVQRALQPRSAAHVEGYRVAGALRSSRQVGGDFYDWEVRDDGLTVTLADVMGKGVAAALLAATVRGVIKTVSALHPAGNPVARAAAVLEEDLAGAEAFATLFRATVRASDGRVRYVDAGHGLAAIVRPGGGYDVLGTDGLPLGIAHQEWVLRDAVLEPGDTLVVFSDGLLDGFDGLTAAFDHVASRVAAAASPRAAVDALLASSLDAEDDVTVVMVSRDR